MIKDMRKLFVEEKDCWDVFLMKLGPASITKLLEGKT
jgi:hypothetical protein